jgi:lysyl-tRNA synthetase class 2
VRDDDARADLLDVLLSSVIEPQLHGWTIISHYPISQAALARAADDDPRVAERFELWVDSTEVANGYAELTDADELDRRMRAQNAQRQQLGKPPLPNPTQLLAAMRSGLPTCSGTALGFDRLVMLACGANTLQDVLTFPW